MRSVQVQHLTFFDLAAASHSSLHRVSASVGLCTLETSLQVVTIHVNLARFKVDVNKYTENINCFRNKEESSQSRRYHFFCLKYSLNILI